MVVTVGDVNAMEAAMTKNLATEYFDYLLSISDNNKNLVFYDSEQDMVDYVTGSDYDDYDNLPNKVGFAVVFHNADVARNQYDYSIRSNFTDPWEVHINPTVCFRDDCKLFFADGSDGVHEDFIMPSTSLFTDDITHPQSSANYFGYSYTGFLAIQKATDEFLLSYDVTNPPTDTVSVTLQPSTTLMPTKEFRTDNFTQVIAGLLPIFYMLAFLYPFSRFIRALVLEKEDKIKRVC